MFFTKEYYFAGMAAVHDIMQHERTDMFYSILFPDNKQYGEKRNCDVPKYFKDLNIDQIINACLRNKKEYGLESFFMTPLSDEEVIRYRQDVFKDLENDSIKALFMDFSVRVAQIGRYMGQKWDEVKNGKVKENRYISFGRILDYAGQYCDAIKKISDGLTSLNLSSQGLNGFKDYLKEYVFQGVYKDFTDSVYKLRDVFGKLEYCMLIKHDTIRVKKYEGQEDLTEKLISIFSPFAGSNAKDYRHKIQDEPYADYVEDSVLAMLSKLYRDEFVQLEAFCEKYKDFGDEIIIRFSNEIQFYLLWLNLVNDLRQAGLSFCYPEVSHEVKHIYAIAGFDLALAREKYRDTITNDFEMKEPEHIIAISGPNNGGKTTFAREFGQMNYLAALGLCVPGKEASLFLFDNIYTHFGREEITHATDGKLQDDLVRIHDIFMQATGKSIIIVNEIFASTTLNDALTLGGHMMDKFAELGCPCVVVTFLDELANHGSDTVSMMSTIYKDDPSKRTYKIVRKPPDGLAYAMTIAGKHGLTYDEVVRRIGE